MDWGPFGDFFETLNAEKNWNGAIGIFQHPFCRKTKKIEGGPLVEIYFLKSHNAKKTVESFSLARNCRLRGEKDFFRFSSLGKLTI